MNKCHEKYLTLGFALIACAFVGVSWMSQDSEDVAYKPLDGTLRAESEPLIDNKQYGTVPSTRVSDATADSFAQRIFSHFGSNLENEQKQPVSQEVANEEITEERNVIVAHGTMEDVDDGFSLDTFLDKWREDREEKDDEDDDEEESDDDDERRNIASADISLDNKFSSREENEEQNIESREILIENASRGGSFGQIIAKSDDEIVSMDIRAEDAIQRRMLEEMRAIQIWAEGEELIFSEMGISNNGDDAKYIALANKFFEAANPMGFSVTAWAVGDWWGDYNVSLSLGNRISTTGVSGPFVNNPTTDRYIRGVNLAGGEFGMGSNGDGEIGAINDRYTYHAGSAMWQEIKNRGFTHVRFPFRLERLFNLDGSFNEADKRLFLEGLSEARRVGLKVLLDPHNYGTLQMNGNNSILERSAFTQDLYNTMMRNLAQLAVENSDIVTMIGLMNEPKNVDPKDWERQSQSALDAVRSQGFTGVIEVPTAYWQGVQDAPTIHPDGPWIDDPLDNIMYGVHHYFDRNHSGSYQRSYAEDERDLRQYYSPGTVRILGVQ